MTVKEIGGETARSEQEALSEGRLPAVWRWKAEAVAAPGRPALCGVQSRGLHTLL